MVVDLALWMSQVVNRSRRDNYLQTICDHQFLAFRRRAALLGEAAKTRFRVGRKREGGFRRGFGHIPGMLRFVDSTIIQGGFAGGLAGAADEA